MKKTKIVLFQDGYARILVNPDHDTLQNIFQSGLPYFTNPDLSNVAFTSPEYWKIEQGKIVAMTPKEQELRNKDPELQVPHNPIFIEKQVRIPYIQFKAPIWAKWAIAIAVVEFIALSILLGVR